MRLAVAVAFALASLIPTPRAGETFTPEDVLGIVSYTVGDLTDDGRYIAATSSVRRESFGQDFRRDGDPTYVRGALTRVLLIDTKTGQQTPIFTDKKSVRGMRWSVDGARLAMLVFNGDVYEPVIWTKATNKSATLKLPAGKYVAENSDIRWTPDGKGLVFTARTQEWRKRVRETFGAMTGVTPVYVQSSKDPFLAWDAIRREGNVRSVMTLDVATGQAREQVPELALTNYTLAEDGSAITYAKDIVTKTDYESGGAETSLRVRDPAGVERVLFATTRGMQIQWADDGKRYAYSNAGRVYLGGIADTTKKLIAGAPEPRRGETPDTSKAARDKAALERFSVVRYSPTGDAVLISNREGMWLADASTGAREKVVAANDSSETLPRVAFAAWSTDGRQIFLTTASRQKWERGIVRYDRSTKQLKELVKDGRSYSQFRLSKDGRTVVMNIAGGNRPPDLYAANTDLSDVRRLVETNPQLASRKMGPTELVTFLDADGHPKKMVVYYPADYDKSKTYPTVFEIYEEYFDDTFNNIRANVLTGAGYVVALPSVDFDIGYPGEAWTKGVTAAANKLIEMGVADSARLGVQGQSYGGYATNLLITQTNRFKAAVNISGKVDMISFYTDSPRLGVRNVNAAERTQDRLGASMWAQPQKYVAHSAVMFADRITTPLMLVTGEQDSNVPALNTREMYYALRRLGKECIWVNYSNGGHGGGTATAEDFVDMQKRIIGFYDERLKLSKPRTTSN